MAAKKVVVLGGGVAGMSAAHELIRRGYDVHVYEKNKVYCGGKARSVNVPGTNTQHPDKYLPGEHGFRFFPGFYKHVTATMKQIPFRNRKGKLQRNGCFANLTPTSRIMIARYCKPPIITTASFPKNLKDMELLVHDMHGSDSGISPEGIKFFAERMWQLMTSSIARRDGDYEGIGWWDYLEADRFNENYKSLLVEGLTRTLVAAQAKTASTKTGGNVLLQLVFNMMSPGVNTDRVLNGPTNDVWLDPWFDYLKESGVKYHFGHEVTHIACDQGKIKSATIKPVDGEEFVVEGDHFILAAPVERAAPLLNDEILKADPTLGTLKELASDVAWMNGIQYYLNQDVEITNGHCIYSNSEWAVTSISQIQFWKDYDLSDRYNGKVKGILSVDVSDWETTRYKGKTDCKNPDGNKDKKGKLAADCPPEEVAMLVWEQIEQSLNVGGAKVLDKSMIEHFYVDRDIKWNRIKEQNTDEEPLLVNKVNTWALRPESYCGIPNLFFASDYVRTNTDLATMEGANEAARRAVNGILAADDSSQAKCEIWPLEEPWFFSPLKWWDRRRFAKGLPYSMHPPWWLKIFMFFWGLVYMGIYLLKTLWFWITGR